MTRGGAARPPKSRGDNGGPRPAARGPEITGRINSIDALRGLSITLMVAHHLLFDLVVFMGAPAWMFSNPVFDVLQRIFAGVFIFLAGVSSRFSRSNIRRGFLTLTAALAVTLTTKLVGMTVIFGVLHLLAFCMLFYGLLGGFLERINRAAAPVIYAVCLAGSAFAVRFLWIGGGRLWILGWYGNDFSSADYFPIFPWLFVFLLGTWAGAYVREGGLPRLFYEINIPFFAALGRKSLIIYLLHQPILYAAVTGLSRAL
jgi:uncharacterized membrane protein